MANRRKIVLDRFDLGMMTDPSATELPAAAARRLEFADVRNRDMVKLPGTAAYNESGLSASLIIYAEKVFTFTKPSEQEVKVVYGTLSGVHKLYCRPYLNSSGTWTDAWLDLTEIEPSGGTTLTADAGTTTSSIVDAALSSSTNDYYKGWGVVVYSGGSPSRAAWVTGYTGSTKTLALSWAITGLTTGSEYFLLRNPGIYLSLSATGDSVFEPEDNHVEFVEGDNFLEILTNSAYSYGSNSNPRSDLILSTMVNREMFDLAGLTYTGMHLTRKNVDYIDTDGICEISEAAVSANESSIPQPPDTLKIHIADRFIWRPRDTKARFPGEQVEKQELFVDASGNTINTITTTVDGVYIIVVVPVYDGYQEGPLYPGKFPYDGTLFSSEHIVAISATGKKIQLDFTVFAGTAGATHIPFQRPLIKEYSTAWTSQASFGVSLLDRRVTAFRVYLASGATSYAGIGAQYKITGAFVMVKEIQVNSSDWSGTGPSFTQTVYITGDDYAGGQLKQEEMAFRQGHDNLRVHGNAAFGTSVKRTKFYGNLNSDEDRPSFIVRTPINSDGLNTYSIMPFTSVVDASSYNIQTIIALENSFEMLVVIGHRNILLLNPDTLAAREIRTERSVVSKWGIINIEGIIYIAAEEEVFMFHAGNAVPRGIMTGRIRTEWQQIALASRQAAAIGYDSRYNFLVVAAGATIYLYNLPKVTADTLAADTQAIGAWHKYPVDYTFTRFFTDNNGACIGITSDGEVRELFSSSAEDDTQLIYESPVIEGPIAVDEMKFNYTAPDVVTVELFDVARSSTYPLKKFKLPPQAVLNKYSATDKAKMQAQLFQFRLTGPSGGNTTERFASITINPDPLDEDTALKR